MLNERKWKIADIAVKTGLSIGAATRAVQGSDKRINITTATLIAEAFGMKVDDLAWPSKITNTGRPALTGGTYTTGAGKQKSRDGYPGTKVSQGTESDLPRRLRRRHFEEHYCPNPEHNLLLPLSGICDLCVA